MLDKIGILETYKNERVKKIIEETRIDSDLNKILEIELFFYNETLKDSLKKHEIVVRLSLFLVTLTMITIYSFTTSKYIAEIINRFKNFQSNFFLNDLIEALISSIILFEVYLIILSFWRLHKRKFEMIINNFIITLAKLPKSGWILKHCYEIKDDIYTDKLIENYSSIKRNRIKIIWKLYIISICIIFLFCLKFHLVEPIIVFIGGTVIGILTLMYLYLFLNIVIKIFPQFRHKYSFHNNIEISGRLYDLINIILSNPEIKLYRMQKELNFMINRISKLIENYNSDYEISNDKLKKASQYFIQYNEWIKYPQKGTFENLLKELIVYLDIFITGEIHRLPIDESVEIPIYIPTKREKTINKLIFGLSIIVPFVLIFILEKYVRISSYPISTNIIYTIIVIWILNVLSKNKVLNIKEAWEMALEIIRVRK